MRTIDADALTEILETMAKDEWNQQVGSSKGLEDAIDIIENAPTVEERPQGEWKYTTHYARRYRVCPICTAEKEDDRSAGWNFCWHCGADMRKGGAE